MEFLLFGAILTYLPAALIPAEPFSAKSGVKTAFLPQKGRFRAIISPEWVNLTRPELFSYLPIPAADFPANSSAADTPDGM